MNIWKDGYTIERDGQKITLTHAEIAEIANYLDVDCGRSSVEYYIENIPEEETEKIAAAQKILKNDNLCFEIYDRYYDAITDDTGSLELEIVDDYVNEVMQNN